MDRNTRCKKKWSIWRIWKLYDEGRCTDIMGDLFLHWVAYIAFWTDTKSSVCFLARNQLVELQEGHVPLVSLRLMIHMIREPQNPSARTRLRHDYSVAISSL